VNDTVFKTSSFPGTTEAESEENSVQAAAPIEQAHDPNDAAPLKITGEQSIRTADELQKALAEHLDRGLDVVVDLSEVDECDTAAMQLIYALRQSAVQRKQRFHITAVSPAITETAAALGLGIEELMTPCGPAVPDGDREAAGEDNGI
jgi:anti-anti-sigma factor